MWASPEYYLKWKPVVTKCGSLVFQLAPSAPRKSGCGIGSWRTPTEADKGKVATPPLGALVGAWPTPKSTESGPDYAIADREKSGGISLPTAIGTWGTPQSMSPNPAAHSQINGTWYFPARGPLAYGCLALTEKFADRLIILSCWLQGYTLDYIGNWEKKKK
jgi:hypothetical protein